MAMFNEDEVVQATDRAQGMKTGHRYRILRVTRAMFWFGEITAYEIRELDKDGMLTGPLYGVSNLHVIAKRVN